MTGRSYGRFGDPLGGSWSDAPNWRCEKHRPKAFFFIAAGFGSFPTYLGVLRNKFTHVAHTTPAPLPLSSPERMVHTYLPTPPLSVVTASRYDSYE